MRLLSSGHVPDDPTEVLSSEAKLRLSVTWTPSPTTALIDLPRPQLPTRWLLLQTQRTCSLRHRAKSNTRRVITSARLQLDRAPGS